jgi:hypothetical protein
MADVTLTAQIRANVDVLNANINSAVQTVRKGARDIDNESQKAEKGVKKFAGNSSMALINLGRVAQDIPFGFIAIQNNIVPLVESLGGAAGLGAAISVVTAAITIFIQRQQAESRALKDTKKSADDYAATLSDIRQAQLKGNQEAGAELTRLDLLYKATQNTTMSMRDRNSAYDELMDKYPKFFTNADRENTLLGKNYTAYYGLRDAILAAARAKAYENKIGELSNKEYENEEKLVDLVKDRTLARKELLEIENKVDSQKLSMSGKANFTDELKLINARTRLNDIESSINDKLNEQAKVKSTIDDLNNRATTEEAKSGFKTLAQLDDKNAKLAEQKTYLQQLEAQLNKLQSAEAAWIASGNTQDFFHLTDRERDINGLIEKIKQLKDATDGIDAPQLRSLTGNDIAPTSLALSVNPSTEEMQKATDAVIKYNNGVISLEANKRLLISAEEREAHNLQVINNLIGNGLTNAFESAIQGTQSFVSAMGQFLTQLISRLAAAFAAAVALSAVLSFTGIGTLLGISAGASDVGSLFKTLSGINFLAEGGITNGPTLAMIGEGKEREVVAPLSKFDAMVQDRANNQFSDGQFVTRISGRDIDIVYKRQQKRNSRLG